MATFDDLLYKAMKQEGWHFYLEGFMAGDEKKPVPVQETIEEDTKEEKSSDEKGSYLIPAIGPDGKTYTG